MKEQPKDRLYDKLKTKPSIKKAWQSVYQNGLQSLSLETQKDIKDFKQSEDIHMKDISQQLTAKLFIFPMPDGRAIKKSSGSNRPLVLFPIRARIVQRAILDQLQSRKKIKKYFNVPTSFGAIPKKGVCHAVKAVRQKIEDGAKFYLKTDIKDFFTKIPMQKIIDKISSEFNDEEFRKLLKDAMDISVKNLRYIEKENGIQFSRLFDFSEFGVPQGSCLSPLFANIILYEFDQKMNTHDISCFRYLDDILFLGPSIKDLNGILEKGKKILDQNNLSLYSSQEDASKAKSGNVKEVFEFLGVEFNNGIIRPSPKAVRKFFESIDKLLADKKKPLVEKLATLNLKIKGWGNQYQFCNDKSHIGNLDVKINEKLVEFLDKNLPSIVNKDYKEYRKLLGVHLLSECKKKNENNSLRKD